MDRIAFLSLFILIGCSFPKHPHRWENKLITPRESNVAIKIGGKGKALKVHYTGCGGLIMDQGPEAIATDLFFSNPPFLSIQLGKIFSQPEAIQSGLQSLERSNIDPRKIRHLLIE